MNDIPGTTEPISGKICCGCNLFVDIKLFGKQSSCKDGLQTTCKSCKKIKDAAYFRKNSYKKSKQNKSYSNPDWYHPRLKMFVYEKWAMDDMRNKILESCGYKIIVLWEQDIEKSNYDISKLLA